MTSFYLSKRGAVKLWESLWASYRLHKRKLPREVFRGRNAEGLAYLLTKAAKLDYKRALPDIYTALYILYDERFGKHGSLAHSLLDQRGYQRATKSD